MYSLSDIKLDKGFVSFAKKKKKKKRITRSEQWMGAEWMSILRRFKAYQLSS